ncbi:MAG: ATP-binding protein [Gammaproteobacteria bacterium]
MSSLNLEKTAPAPLLNAPRVEAPAPSALRNRIGILSLVVFIVVLVLLLARTLDSQSAGGLPDRGEISQVENLDAALTVELARSVHRGQLNKPRLVGLMDNLDQKVARLERRAEDSGLSDTVRESLLELTQRWRHKQDRVLAYLSQEQDDTGLHARLLGMGMGDSVRGLLASIEGADRERRARRDNARLILGLWLGVGLLVGIWRLRSDGRTLMRLNQALKAEASLREATANEYQQLVENANSAIVRMDSEMRLTYFNAYAEKLFGFEADEVLGRSLLGTILPKRDQDGQDYQLLVSKILENPDRFNQIELENRRSDGASLWCIWNLKAVYHDGERELLAVGTDMTLHRRAESLVLTQNRILSEVARGESAAYLFQSVCKLVRYRVPQALCTIHTNISGSAEEIGLIGVDTPTEFLKGLEGWHYDPGQVVGERDLMFLDIDSPELAEVSAVMAQASLKRCWIRGFGADDYRGFIAVWTEAKAREPDGREREVLFSAGMIAGITAERDHLDRQLRAAKEEAEMNAATKSSFLARMSHEIRTPMSGLIGVLTLLKDREDIPTEPSQHLTMAYNSAEGLLALLDDILDMSKIESGKLEIESVPFALRDLIEEVAELFAQRASSKGVLLITDVDYDLPRNLMGDPTRIRQVISNLVGNAVKFTDSGEIEIRVELIESLEQSARVRFSVRDTGIGIPEDAQEKIFDSFVQAKSSTTRKYGGTGLGLPLSRDLVQRMGGELAVESVPSQGSRFGFYLEMPLDADSQSTSDSSAVDSFACRGGQACVIDFSLARGRSIGAHLRAMGIESHFCPDRDGAAQLMRELDFDVVLDCSVPGSETEMEDLLNRCAARNIALIRIDGNPFGMPRAEQGYQYVSSPVRASNLVDAVERSLGHEVTPAAAEPASPQASEIGGLNTSSNQEASMEQPVSVRILLVEDQEVNRLVARGLLEKLGHMPDEVENGALAVDAVREKPYDLILMDCEMPILDGYGATEQIRAWEKENGGHVPIVAVTAHALPEHKQRCLATGMDDYLAKPYKLSDLRKVIENWVGDLSASATEPPLDAPTDTPSEPRAAGDEMEDVGNAIDREEFQDILDTFGDDISQLVDSFAEVLPRKLTLMREALENADSESLRSEAHSLKGIANTVAARPSGLLCKTLEDAGRAAELEGADQVLADLEVESARALQALKAAMSQ